MFLNIRWFQDRGSCQLYRVNSLSPNVDIIRNDPFEATSVLIEVLDKCISNETESFLNKIDPELAQKFIDWSKNLNADKPEENTSSFSNIDNWGLKNANQKLLAFKDHKFIYWIKY